MKDNSEERKEAQADVDILNVTANKHTCMVIVSVNPGSLGTVLNCNEELYSNLGYQTKELIGQNIAMITPSYIGQTKHDELIENFINKGESKFLGKRRIVTTVEKKGYLINIRICVKILPNVKDGLRLIGIFPRSVDSVIAAREKWLVVIMQPTACGLRLPRSSATSLRPTVCSHLFA